MKDPRLQQWQGLLLREVGEGLTPQGFVARPKDQSFVRGFSEGRQEFHLAFIEHETDFDVTADVAVRFDRLEEMVNADNKLLSAKETAGTCSLGIELGNLVNGRQFRWTVASDKDVGTVARSVVDWFEQHALAYFERYSEMGAAFDVLSPVDRSAWMQSPLHGARAKRVIGLATLLGRHDQLAALIEQQENYLVQLKDFGLADFRKFAERLAKRD